MLDTMTSLPPRAHFLGLPLEIRLKVYEYLLVRMWSYWVLESAYFAAKFGTTTLEYLIGDVYT